MLPKINCFYFVTDSRLSRQGIESDVLAAIECGVEIVQFREKRIDYRELIETAAKLKKLCKRRALFIVNDSVELAIAIDADGVHLGQSDMSILKARTVLGAKIIGVSTHSLDEAIQAQNNGADYISVGPIFKTTTKSDAHPPVGLSTLKAVKKSVELPIVAIGGITLETAPDVIKAGANAICSISAVLSSQDTKSEIKKFQKLFT